MALRPLPSPWNVYNLAGSPFFQETLEAGERTGRPLSLFVGRQAELRRLVDAIHGAGENSSRQAVAGSPGVGKTTLVKELKAIALDEGYLAADEFVPIVAADTAESLFGRVLGALYDTILANRPQSVDAPAMQAAQLLVRVARLGTGGASLSALGVGVGVSRGTTVVTPREILIDGPRVMRDLMRLVRESDARGVLLHLNNLENLSEADASRAAESLRDLRDLMLMHGGLHYVIVGTTDAVNVAVNSHQQIRNIVSTLLLEPLAIADVHAMLRVRYEHLRLDESAPVVPPIADDAVAAIYAFFRGDLRGLLKALEDGITPLIGLAGDAARPLTSDEIRPVLRQRYAAELASLPEQSRVEQLTRWGTADPSAVHTQKSLAELWSISQPSVSAAIGYLVRQAYVQALPRSAGTPTQYVLSGAGRLIFG